MLDPLEVLGEVRDRAGLNGITARQLSDDTGEHVDDVLAALDRLRADRLVEVDVEPILKSEWFTVSEAGFRRLAEHERAPAPAEPEALL